MLHVWLLSLPTCFFEAVKVLIVPVGILPGSGSPYICSHERRSRIAPGNCISIGCFLCTPSMFSLVMLGQKNFFPTVHGFERKVPASLLIATTACLYIGRGACCHAVSYLKMGSTCGFSVERFVANPMLVSSTRTFFSPMARDSSMRISVLSFMGFAPGFIQLLCGSLSELCFMENVPCVGGNERFASYTGMLSQLSPQLGRARLLET
mmetsp:Transcript_5184/g.7632  ORF Transcript_5184/g.7632 Transcript_5184/m.7632 type:complete len:208 (-) Transcript_5184:127-750(-)